MHNPRFTHTDFTQHLPLLHSLPGHRVIRPLLRIDYLLLSALQFAYVVGCALSTRDAAHPTPSQMLGDAKEEANDVSFFGQ